MADDLRIEYTVKEIVERIAHKIDKLDDKFDKFAENIDGRVTTLEASKVTAEQIEAANTKAKWSLYGIGLTGLGVIIDYFTHK